MQLGNTWMAWNVSEYTLYLLNWPEAMFGSFDGDGWSFVLVLNANGYSVMLGLFSVFDLGGWLMAIFWLSWIEVGNLCFSWIRWCSEQVKQLKKLVGVHGGEYYEMFSLFFFSFSFFATHAYAGEMQFTYSFFTILIWSLIVFQDYLEWICLFLISRPWKHMLVTSIICLRFGLSHFLKFMILRMLVTISVSGPMWWPFVFLR